VRQIEHSIVACVQRQISVWTCNSACSPKICT
jgi:hypothetical protein